MLSPPSDAMRAGVSALWERIDAPGHDAARVCRTDVGWRLEGTAVFAHAQGPACLSYRVDCAPDWRTRRGAVAGWVGQQRCDVHVVRTDTGQWKLNGRAVDGLEPCLDVDFGFTPATNFLQLNRSSLRVGEKAEFPVAWLDAPEPSLTRLPQRYERRSDTTYWYESPRHAYSALLEIADSGFVRTYPGLWVLVAAGP